MGGSPRPMEPMGPHRPRALKYTPMGGPRGPSASGPEIYPHGGVPEANRPRPIGQGPSAKAHGAHGAPYGHVFLDLVFLAQSRPSWGVNPSTPWPPGGFRPNLCSTKIASRASWGRWGLPMGAFQKSAYKIRLKMENIKTNKVNIEHEIVNNFPPVASPDNCSNAGL